MARSKSTGQRTKNYGIPTDNSTEIKLGQMRFTNIREFPTKYQQLWKHIVFSLRTQTFSRDLKEINKEKQNKVGDLTENLNKLFASKTIDDLEFLLFMLDEPYPELWPGILENLNTLDPAAYPVVLSKMTQMANSPYVFERQGILYKIPKQYSSFHLASGEERILNTTGVDQREIEYILNLQYTTDFGIWYPLIWKRVERNLSFLLKEGGGWYEENVHLDSQMMQYFLHLLVDNLSKETQNEIVLSLFGIWFNDQQGRGQYGKMITRRLENLLYTVPFNEVDWVVNEFIPVFLQNRRSMRVVELTTDLRAGKAAGKTSHDMQKIIHKFIITVLERTGDLKHIMRLTGLLNEEIVLYTKFSTETKSFSPNEGKPHQMNRGRVQKYADNPEYRDVIFQYMTILGNKLVKGDSTLASSIDGLFGPIEMLKQTIDDRRCCKMNGRNGDRYCMVCGRVIPDEYIVSV